MLWILLALLSATCICMGQDSGESCQCVPYFLCKSNTQRNLLVTSTESSSPVGWRLDEEDYCNCSAIGWRVDEEEDSCSCQCQGYYNVCCDMGGNPIVTQTMPVHHTPPVTQSMPVEPPVNPDCGRTYTVIDWKVCCDDDVDTRFGEFPWMVAIMKVSSFGRQQFLCGGSIIEPFVILTTAHNLKGLNADQLLVKAGIWNTTDPTEVAAHQDRSVAQVLLHPNFSKTKVANDFALLFLKENLQVVSNNVVPVCRPSQGFKINRTRCVATGWGADSYGNPNLQSVLKKVELPLVDPKSCQVKLRQTELGSKFNLHSSFICAGGENADTCKGDGGGPLMCPMIDDKDRYVQVGITSWGVGCNNNIPGVYSNVYQASSWIEVEIAKYRSQIKV